MASGSGGNEMSELLTQPDKPCGLLRTSAAWTVAMLLGVIAPARLCFKFVHAKFAEE